MVGSHQKKLKEEVVVHPGQDQPLGKKLRKILLQPVGEGWGEGPVATRYY